FHDVDNAFVQRRGAHPTLVVKFLKGLGNTRLVRNGEHAHPAAEHAQRVDAVEGLRAAADLHDGKRAALRRSYGTKRKWQVIDLCFHDARDLAMPLGAAPDLAF